MHVTTLCVIIGFGCSKHESPEPPVAPGPKKPRAEVMLWFDPRGEVPADAVKLDTTTPPASRQTLERAGIHFAIVGLPKGLSAAEIDQSLVGAVVESERTHINATIVITHACLADIGPVLEKNPIPLWPIAVVVGAGCGREFKPFVGVTALLEAGTASRARMTFDRRTGYVLKIEPIK